MSLTDEQIKALLTVAEKPKRQRTKKASIDYVNQSSRTYENWFKLAHKLFDEETQDAPKCANPNCVDRERRGALVANVVGVDMCRVCFLEGYMTIDSNQGQL